MSANEEKRERFRAYYRANREKILARRRAIAAHNRPCARKKNLEWRRNNPEKVRAGLRSWQIRRYGISVEQYDSMVAEQRNRCAICGEEESFTDKRRGTVARLAIDHCHVTGRVRALLCRSCNGALGNLRDRPDLALRAAAYLEAHGGSRS